MPDNRFQPDLDRSRRVFATGLIDAVLAAVDPGIALRRHLDIKLFTSPTHILAFGKASIPMANAAIEALGNRFARATVLSTPDLCAQAEFKSSFVELLPATHPLPSAVSIASTNTLVEHARSIPADHQALVLISGGGSSMLCSPKPEVTLGDIIAITETLNRKGAPIETLNAERGKHETLKAGGLAKILTHTARTDAFVLSDVIGDDLRTIASGPLIEAVPPSIPHTIIASNTTALNALCAWVSHEHIDAVCVERSVTGSASCAGQTLAQCLLDSTATPPIAGCLGGEPTVDAGSTQGIGGPMLELALAAARELIGSPFRWTVITIATDGIDGLTDATGAILTDDMLNAPSAAHLLDNALKEHNALPICDQLGATIRTGATGTNVNDIALVIRWED